MKLADRRKSDATAPNDLPVPSAGNKVYYDGDPAGFGVRVTAQGARSFVLNYRIRSSGRERRYTIGSWPAWSVDGARKEAHALRRRIQEGGDPVGDLHEVRAAPTIAELVERFRDEHLPRKRPSTQKSYQGILDHEILPDLRHIKVADVRFGDIDGLHQKITRRGTPYRANRVAAVLSKLFSLAIKWGWRTDNPVKGLERNQEIKRQRYLTGEELVRLTAALAADRDQQAANIIRLLLLTGARSGEVRAARWEDIDLGDGVWTKPGATTKQRTEHRVPLSGPVRLLLADIRKAVDDDAKFVFPGPKGHRLDIDDEWARICKAAGIQGARIHDLRHTYASVLVSSGQSLPIVGALLGHTQPATTARYAHLFDDPLRKATERAGAIIGGTRPKRARPLLAR